MDKLTKKQRQLRKELSGIAETIGVDYWNILKSRAGGQNASTRGD
jgi:hypothetical protein